MLCLNDQKKVQDYRTCSLTNDRCMYICIKTAKSKYTGEISFLFLSFLLFTKYSNICISYVRNRKDGK